MRQSGWRIHTAQFECSPGQTAMHVLWERTAGKPGDRPQWQLGASGTVTCYGCGNQYLAIPADHSCPDYPRT